MATELDKLIVKVQADISDLQKGLAKANGAVAGASKKCLVDLIKQMPH